MVDEVSAGFVVFRVNGGGREYLLLQNSSSKFWDFPKGKVDRGETLEQAARRELMEEAGIAQIDVVPEFEARISYSYRLKGNLVEKEVVMFLGESRGDGDVRLSWEHSDFRWVPFDEGARLLYDKKVSVLQRAEDFLSKKFGIQKN